MSQPNQELELVGPCYELMDYVTQGLVQECCRIIIASFYMIYTRDSPYNLPPSPKD
jgi:hypothetical protein